MHPVEFEKTAIPAVAADKFAAAVSPHCASPSSFTTAPAEAAGGRGNRFCGSETPWYLAPASLAILTTMTRPERVSGEHRYVLTVDRWSSYTGPDMDALRAIHASRFHELDRVEPWSAAAMEPVMCASPADVVGALFGDPECDGNYRTFCDDSPEWEAVRRNVARALELECTA